jgi:hypothetical protein
MQLRSAIYPHAITHGSERAIVHDEHPSAMIGCLDVCGNEPVKTTGEYFGIVNLLQRF